MNFFKTAPYRKVLFKAFSHQKSMELDYYGTKEDTFLPLPSVLTANLEKMARKLLKFEWWWSLGFVDIYKDNFLELYTRQSRLCKEAWFALQFCFYIRMRTFAWEWEKLNVTGQRELYLRVLWEIILKREIVRGKAGKLKPFILQCVSMYICIHIYTYMYVYMRMHRVRYTYICIYVYIYICM